MVKTVQATNVKPSIKKILEEDVRPTLTYLGLGGLERLVMGTGAQESGFKFLHQLGGGPALSWWQIEPATEKDVNENYVGYHKDLIVKLQALLCSVPSLKTSPLEWNPKYACAICAFCYARHGAALGEPILSLWPTSMGTYGESTYEEIEKMAKTYKKWYNTANGKATEAEFIKNYTALIAPIYTEPTDVKK